MIILHPVLHVHVHRFLHVTSTGGHPLYTRQPMSGNQRTEVPQYNFPTIFSRKRLWKREGLDAQGSIPATTSGKPGKSMLQDFLQSFHTCQGQQTANTNITSSNCLHTPPHTTDTGPRLTGLTIIVFHSVLRC